MNRPMLVFSTQTYAPLLAHLLHGQDFEEGLLERRVFPDGERYLRILTDVEDREVAVLGGTISDADTLELYDLACGIVKNGAERLHLVIPYFGYSTMERAVMPGEVVTAKTRARLLSAIPGAPWGNRVVLLDLHTEGLPHYFEGAMRPTHVYAKPVITQAIHRLGGERYVLACTDAGRAKWVESLANDLGVNASFVFKKRLDGEHTQITAVSAQVEDQTVVIYDDMIRTGGSLLSAARAYLQAGAKEIAAVATHGIFPGDALKRLQDSGVLTRIITTDSHPRARALENDFLQVVSVGSLLATTLKCLV